MLVPSPRGYRWGYQVWVNPQDPASARCAHHPHIPVGHTSLYTIYDMYSDDVLYIGITGSLSRRFYQHKRTKPWWERSENAFIECYDSWGSAAEAEIMRIQSARPVHNVQWATGAPPDGMGRTLCSVCGGVIIWRLDDGDDPSQHDRCNFEVAMAYEMGQASMLPDDHPWVAQVRERYEKGFDQ
jgi:hypothetical protein